MFNIPECVIFMEGIYTFLMENSHAYLIFFVVVIIFPLRQGLTL